MVPKNVERFTDFFDVSSGWTSKDLFNLSTKNFKTFYFKKKNRSDDGSGVMAGHLNDLQTKVKSLAPQALFTHCCCPFFKLSFEQCVQFTSAS